MAAAINFSGLDRWGLISTEGHRAIPAWEMARSGEWLVPQLFEQPYLRKPPGIQWLIGGFSLMLGESEAAARVPSALCATLGAFLVLFFTGRWFGWKWGGVAAAAHVLMPLLWTPARSAEIEAANLLFTQVAVYAMLDLLVGRSSRASRPGSAILHVSCIALGLTGAALLKGPASLPLLPATILGACLATQSLAPARSRALWTGIALGVVAMAAVAWAILSRARAFDGDVVTQGVSEFLWSLERVPQVLGMPFVALASAAPVSFAILFPFGRHAHRETLRHDPVSFERAQALALTAIFALVIYTVAGVHNPRYAMPAVAILSPLVGYVVRGMSPTGPAPMTRPRRIWARVFTLGHPAVMGLAMLGLFLFHVRVLEAKRGMTSGRAAGVVLADSLPDGSTLIVRDLVEARPETVWYAVREAERQGRRVRALWEPDEITDVPPGTLLLLRTDDMSREAQVILERGGPAIEPIASLRVHKYDATLYRVVSPESP